MQYLLAQTSVIWYCLKITEKGTAESGLSRRRLVPRDWLNFHRLQNRALNILHTISHVCP